jgi:hypothetical protein
VANRMGLGCDVTGAVDKAADENDASDLSQHSQCPLPIRSIVISCCEAHVSDTSPFLFAFQRNASLSTQFS